MILWKKDKMSDEKVILECDTYGSGQNTGVCIICAPTGIICTVQAGGMVCMHPETEGFPVAIYCDMDFNKSLDKFNDCSWGCCIGIKDEKYPDEYLNNYANNINIFLSENLNNQTHEPMSFEFDHSRIKEIMEGWWPVLVSFKNTEFYRDKEKPFYENKFKGYLYFGNCD
jgi:hypothetical protein